MAKKFFYACGGILMLALAYHFGAQSASAQASTPAVAGISAYGAGVWAITNTGDVYVKAGGPWQFDSNIFSGSPVRTSDSSWGQIKARYR